MDTVLRTYGEAVKDTVLRQFSWERILSESPLWERCSGNPPRFEARPDGGNAYRVFVHGPVLQPEDMGQLSKLQPLLRKAVSAFYGADCILKADSEGKRITIWMHRPVGHPVYGFRPGDQVYYGRYPQGPGGEVLPIRWRVLTVTGSVAFLLAENALIRSAYWDGPKDDENTWYRMWGNSLARQVCCGQFPFQAFSEEERRFLYPVEIREAANGPRCSDAVFLLSEEEAFLFLPDPADRAAAPSAYLRARQEACGTYVDWKTGKTAWWLLPHEHGPIFPKAVLPDGGIRISGSTVYHADFTIRPCISVRLEPGFPGQRVREEDGGNRNSGKDAAGPQASSGYSLQEVKALQGKTPKRGVGERRVWHDTVLGKWHLTIQLDAQARWFLTVYLRENGSVDGYCLDDESASDSHYEFANAGAVRSKLARPGDEQKPLEELLIRHAAENGGSALLSVIYPYVTAQFHYD